MLEVGDKAYSRDVSYPNMETFGMCINVGSKGYRHWVKPCVFLLRHPRTETLLLESGRFAGGKDVRLELSLS